jgi:hypothetical protein
MDAELADRSEEIGGELVWTLVEEQHLQAACRLADAAEQLREMFYAELAGDRQVSALVKISAELRATGKAMLDHLGRVSLDEAPAKSEQHQRAVNARWDRRRAEHEAARRSRGY